MTYSVKEIFYTLQGEGVNAGRAAVFCRLSGCNLWSGREVDRTSAICKFCDTDFVGIGGTSGGKYQNAEALVEMIERHWPTADYARRFVVLTGGEPLLQVDAALVAALHRHGFMIAVETNGTIVPVEGIDWLCVSPKSGATLAVTKGQELKLVYPQDGQSPEQFTHLDFQHFFLQPKDDLNRNENTTSAIEFCKMNPRWSLSLQTHKITGIR